MNCNKNGIKREGKSCSLNNNCIYPNCMKELELEAENYARSFDKNLYGYDGENLSVEDEKQMQDFIAGATSKYVEKQKLEFAIEQLELIDEEKVSSPEHDAFYDLIDMKEKAIKNLQQKLSEL